MLSCRTFGVAYVQSFRYYQGCKNKYNPAEIIVLVNPLCPSPKSGSRGLVKVFCLLVCLLFIVFYLSIEPFFLNTGNYSTKICEVTFNLIARTRSIFEGRSVICRSFKVMSSLSLEQYQLSHFYKTI